MIGRFLRAVWSLYVPIPDPSGAWVAEAWLEWEICRGSTLYRERFATIKDAERAARRGARCLDYFLPPAEGMGIKWGVRRACEADGNHGIWSPYMPGSKHYSGEHATVHPLVRQ